MNRELIITQGPIDEAALVLKRSASSEAGAALYFSGIVRGSEETAPIVAIDYEANETMARHQFDKIFDQVESRWPIESLRLVHRIGVVKVQEPSLWVEIIAGHRGEAFEACQWLIDEMKQVVPIWKHPQLKPE
ncbi:molybdenum cofactor biosynthesis protein MoaE [bacterium]|jgi:molybdopterin synthase catalytic subunit|nr:molybdenum cofactor biosynthesis protein MoaE [Verrucomicrobiota bacterium]MDA7511377.1 molybdenum cofactor biosynthesis protein MoaE [Verrucomicrobiota bacterium]MDA7645471.1 molybdenum cofactor biosynthesis protein MoaE [bacterium]MDA7680290.1 molybdenum cofactor biosynthesis protein MoaE [bacterium]